MRPTKYNKGKKPPAFISHLYRILSDSANEPYIKWRQDQESFIILNIPKFSDIVLPKYYKHSNYSSFVRQMNMYNFTKVRSQLEGQHIFRNELFRKNGEESLRIIKRKEITNNNRNANTMISLAHAINSQIQPENQPISIPDMEIDLIESSEQQSQQLIEMAAPSPEHSFFSDFPNLENLKIFPGISQYLEQTDKIPPTISLKPENIYFPLKTKIDEIKSSQIQLEQICISLFQQNQFLTNENSRLQDKLKNQFKRKQQILTQIIKYVINFLSQWNSNASEVDDQKNFRQNVLSDQDSSSDIVLESYDILGKRKFQNKQNRKKQNRFTFSKHAENQKKILLTLLKEIQNSYNQKFFFTNQGFQSSKSHQFDSRKMPNNSFYQQKNPSKSSPNSFLMSMLLGFIQSNNLAQVIKRFSLLINLQRNKKAKNFTVVNCMKDLKQHFKLKDLFSHQNGSFIGKKCQKFIDYEKLEDESFERFVDKQRFLENEKQTINQMQKQLALMTNPKTKSKELIFLEQELMESSENDSSYALFNHYNFLQKQKSQRILTQLNQKQQIINSEQNSYFYSEEMSQLSDFENEKQNQILQKFNFRLQ